MEPLHRKLWEGGENVAPTPRPSAVPRSSCVRPLTGNGGSTRYGGHESGDYYGAASSPKVLAYLREVGAAIKTKQNSDDDDSAVEAGREEAASDSLLARR